MTAVFGMQRDERNNGNDVGKQTFVQTVWPACSATTG